MVLVSTDSGTRARTRPLDDRLTQQLLAAARHALQVVGPDRFRVDDVVARCNTSKSAIYRRWGGKDAFLTAAVESFAWDDVHPRSTDLAADLDAVFVRWIYGERMTDAEASQLIRSITAHELSRATYESAIWPARETALAALLAHHGYTSPAPSVLRLPQGFVIDTTVAQQRTIRRTDIREFVTRIYCPLISSLIDSDNDSSLTTSQKTPHQ